MSKMKGANDTIKPVLNSTQRGSFMRTAINPAEMK